MNSTRYTVKIIEANYEEEETVYQLARRGSEPKRCSRIGISTASWPGLAETPAPAPNSEQHPRYIISHTSSCHQPTNYIKHTSTEPRPYLEFRVVHPLEHDHGARLAAGGGGGAAEGREEAVRCGCGGGARAEGGGAPAPPEERQRMRRHGDLLGEFATSNEMSGSGCRRDREGLGCFSFWASPRKKTNVMLVFFQKTAQIQ